MTEDTVTSDRYWQNWDKGEAAKRIDEYWLQSEADWRKILVTDIQTEFGRKIPLLEVGCGSGLIYRQMLRRGVVTPTSYVGGDVSQNMLSIARQRFPEARFIDLDILDLDYPDRSRPNVICVHVLQHLPYYDQAMYELARVTDRKLYVVSWFTLGSEDELVFSEPSARWNGQAFYNNIYSLPKFLTFILTNSDRDIQDLRVHHFDGPNYSISLTFPRPDPSHSRFIHVKNLVLAQVRGWLKGSLSERKPLHLQEGA